jgi:hypothetical protein
MSIAPYLNQIFCGDSLAVMREMPNDIGGLGRYVPAVQSPQHDGRRLEAGGKPKVAAT